MFEGVRYVALARHNSPRGGRRVPCVGKRSTYGSWCLIYLSFVWLAA